MARKGVLTASDAPSPRRAMGMQGTAPRNAMSGAVGALQGSLSKLQESAIQEIDPARIHNAGIADRLGPDPETDANLRASLQRHGQQVPVLLRPRAGEPGQYEIVYGRRRVQALRSLGLPVKAMVRQLDDTALVLAQGQENTARRDLTFIEKASFAAQLDVLGYGRETICAALSIDLPMVSRMLKVGRAFDVDFLRQIGAAPGIGRERWLKLVAALDGDGARARVAQNLSALTDIAQSDARFEQVLIWAEGRPPAPATPPKTTGRTSTQKIMSDAGYEIARVKRNGTGLTLTIPDSDAPDFSHWVEEEAGALLKEIYAKWIEKRSMP